MDSQVIQHMAMLMSVNCVRKTVLDDYLSSGRLSQAEVQDLVVESTDKLYTFLTYLLNKSEEDKKTFLEIMNTSFPHDWQSPQLSEVFEEAVAIATSHKSPN